MLPEDSYRLHGLVVPWENNRHRGSKGASSFVARHRFAFTGYERALKLTGATPTLQENLRALTMLRRQLGCSALSAQPLYEKRYPFLDRSLLEFLYTIPREQIVRPGQRRSLMRRALAGIVPEELLNRRRKAFRSRAPLAVVSERWSALEAMSHEMHSVAMGIVNAERFSESLEMARRGELLCTVPFWRTVALEAWLRNCGSHIIASDAVPRSAIESHELGTDLS
jgi:hypothetical protein